MPANQAPVGTRHASETAVLSSPPHSLAWRAPTLLLLASLALSACSPPSGTSSAPEVEYLNAPGTENLGLPFSAAVRVGNTLYLSGQIGNIPGTLDLAPGGIQGQTRQTMDNIKQALEHFGSSMDRVVKCTVFLADMDEWAAMNEVYRTYFENPPARSALGASGLAMNGRVEIECIAVVD
jgi:2-iminobutanoate/2-iminopropanoate deaminase